MTSSRLPAVLMSLAMPAAAITGLVAAVAVPGLPDGPAAEVAASAGHPGRFYVYALFILLSSYLLVPAFLGVVALLRDRAPRWSALAAAIGGTGLLVAVGDAAVELMFWQLGSPAADRSQMVALAARYENALGSSLIYSIGGVATLLGIAIAAIALWRTRVVPRWAAVGLLLGAVANVVGFSSSQAVLIGSYVVLLAAFVPMAQRLLDRPTPETSVATAPLSAGRG